MVARGPVEESVASTTQRSGLPPSSIMLTCWQLEEEDTEVEKEVVVASLSSHPMGGSASV